jgi:hypothetical protein
MRFMLDMINQNLSQKGFCGFAVAHIDSCSSPKDLSAAACKEVCVLIVLGSLKQIGILRMRLNKQLAFPKVYLPLTPFN